MYAGAATPPQTTGLAKIWWPLVLTTNYDDYFVRAYEDHHQEPRDAVTVLGRSAQDCQQVLSSLSAPYGCCLWSLQGYLPREGHHRLQGELVVGHEEYRRVTHTAQHFRRAFAEVFRRRTLLYLGSSLADAYLLDLFGEILEFSGANPMPHYALVQRNSVDASFLRSRFNIIALEYETHDEVPKYLDQLKAELDRGRARPMRWTYSLDLAAAPAACGGADLEIIRGAMPDPSPGELMAVSIGTSRDGMQWISRNVQSLVERHWPPTNRPTGYCLGPIGERFVVGFKNPDGSPRLPIVGVNARANDRDDRDLRLIGDALRELLEWTADQGFLNLRMQLLASGQTAHYPGQFALAEMIRTYGRWRRQTDRAISLKIHLFDHRPALEVATGRLDVVELLSCDDVRFWVEIVDGQQVVGREIVFADGEETLGEIARRFDIPERGWAVAVSPPPRPDSQPHSVKDEWNANLVSVGVVPGVTLRFSAPT